MRFSEEGKAGFPNRYKIGLRKQEIKIGLEFLWWLGGGDGILFELPEDAKGKSKKWGLKPINSQTSKIESDL